MVDRAFYSTNLSQIFSPCGNYLLVGNIYGEIGVFDLQKCLNPDKDKIIATKQKHNHKIVIDGASQVCCMASADKFLVIGTKGGIIGYDWKNILSGKLCKVAWKIDLPSVKDDFEPVYVNTLQIIDDFIYAGCGDSCVHVFALEGGKLQKSLNEHQNFIHDLAVRQSSELVSASEDGTVKLWDLRKKKSSVTIEPCKNAAVNRPELGKWVGFVNVRGDWLLCGGGPKAALWHLGSMQLTTPFNSSDKGIHVALFEEERVLIGSSYKLEHFTLVGEHVGSVPCSANTVYSLVYQQSPHQVMCATGSNPDIDVCTGLTFRDQIWSFRD